MKIRTMLLAASLLFVASARAQEPPRPPHDLIGGALFPPELVMQNQQAIGLDEAQKTAIRGEILKAQSRFTELQWQLQDAMETLASLLQQNLVDEQKVMAQLDKVLPIEREIKRAQLTLMIRIKNKLTPEQQEKLRQLRPTLPPGAPFGTPGRPPQPPEM
ncbi:MAG: periplasmic heavy metal sensor [Acidobacteria bacterium]|nr:periplasmic heavy metal sensor [Acidobacteriota bacterium]